MLKHLTIKNYALITNLETSFQAGFSVLTGETGAGKSIILGALSLILGQRADQQAVKDSSKKCVIEGVFETNTNDLESFFEKHNLDFDSETTILRREILPNGKSRAFINDTPVSLNNLKTLAQKLVDINSQNSTILLQDTGFQMDVLDSFCRNKEILRAYQNNYRQFRILENDLEKLRESENQARSEQDFFKYQLEEIRKANLKPGEQKEIEEKLEILTHAEDIKNRLFNSSNLVEGDNGLNHIFNSILSELKPISNFSNELLQLFERLESNYLDVSDIANELNKKYEQTDINPEQISLLNDRLNLIFHLQHKHRVSNVDELLKIESNYLQKINEFSSLNKKIKATEKKLAALFEILKTSATLISKNRKSAKPILEQKILETISKLGMPNAKINIEIKKLVDLTESGYDNVVFLFNANKGGYLKEMSKIASGGELSRLMLSIKSQVAAKNLISTIIFDEIDSGISGEIAGKMAGIMQKMSNKIQIISITHLPQIAARGRYHYLVQKESGTSTTSISIKQLSHDEKIIEIAKMLSDSKISNSALQTATELLNN